MIIVMWIHFKLASIVMVSTLLWDNTHHLRTLFIPQRQNSSTWFWKKNNSLHFLPYVLCQSFFKRQRSQSAYLLRSVSMALTESKGLCPWPLPLLIPNTTHSVDCIFWTRRIIAALVLWGFTEKKKKREKCPFTGVAKWEGWDSLPNILHCDWRISNCLWLLELPKGLQCSGFILK